MVEKNKPKDLTKSKLGAALKKFQAAEKAEDLKGQQAALVNVKKEVAATLKLCNPKKDIDTISALKKYDKIIAKKITDIKIKTKENGEDATQKVGPQIELYKIDVTKEVLSKYDPSWLVNFKNKKIEIKINADIMSLMNKHGLAGTIKSLNKELKSVGDNAISSIVYHLKKIDSMSKGKSSKETEKLYKSFQKYYRKTVNDAQKDMQKIPHKYWKTFTSKKGNEKYKNYKLKMAVNKFNDTIETVEKTEKNVEKVGGFIKKISDKLR